jgi:hypothetical protein
MICCQVIGTILLSGLIAGAATFLTGLFVLPTLASDNVRSTVGKVIIDLGHNLSMCVLHCCTVPQPVHHKPALLSPLAIKTCSLENGHNRSNYLALIVFQPGRSLWGGPGYSSSTLEISLSIMPCPCNQPCVHLANLCGEGSEETCLVVYVWQYRGSTVGFGLALLEGYKGGIVCWILFGSTGAVQLGLGWHCWRGTKVA